MRFEAGDKAVIVDSQGLLEDGVLDPENGDQVTITGYRSTNSVLFYMDDKDVDPWSGPWSGRKEAFRAIEDGHLSY